MAEFLLRLHLPGVQMSQESGAFAGGTLVHVAFDEWYRLDGTHEYAESKYARTKPLFWEGMSDAADPAHAGLAQARRECGDRISCPLTILTDPHR